MKIVKIFNRKLSFYSREKSLYVTWACFRNVICIFVNAKFDWYRYTKTFFSDTIRGMLLLLCIQVNDMKPIRYELWLL